jgi:hypothetical protein
LKRGGFLVETSTNIIHSNVAASISIPTSTKADQDAAVVAIEDGWRQFQTSGGINLTKLPSLAVNFNGMPPNMTSIFMPPDLYLSDAQLAEFRGGVLDLAANISGSCGKRVTVQLEFDGSVEMIGVTEYQ